MMFYYSLHIIYARESSETAVEGVHKSLEEPSNVKTVGLA
jgi:hypothetical protein